MTLSQTVANGDHISSIAEENGFGRFETIFEADENADLRAIRPNPHQLVPGDLLVIPDKTPEPVEVTVDRAFRVVVQRQQLLVRLKVVDFFGVPVGDQTGTLSIGDDELSVTSDESGLVEASIPRSTKLAELRIAGMTFSLAVGALQPTDEVDGVRARLTNLGYWAGESAVDDAGNEGEFSLGVELFQEDAGLVVDGQLTDDGIAKLLETHGQ